MTTLASNIVECTNTIMTVACNNYDSHFDDVKKYVLVSKKLMYINLETVVLILL